jgi:hypothetical protein
MPNKKTGLFADALSQLLKYKVASLMLAGLLGGATLPAQAAEVAIRAEFKPDPARPNFNTFENKTPNSGFCASYPVQCAAIKSFSLRVPLRFDSSGPIEPLHTSPRQGAMFSVPAQWRELMVTHTATGETETLQVRISGIGSRYITDPVVDLVGGGVTALQAHQLLWGSRWVGAPAPCRSSPLGAYSGNYYQFFWLTPVVGDCAKQARFNIPWMTYDYLDFAYELITPNPLGMSIGEYKGAVTYSVGPGKDFDLGDVMLPNDSELLLNFTLDVQHHLKVEIPPGANRIELVPQGGWQSWVQQGRRPTRLFRDQTFNMWSSGRFKMELQCQFPVGNTCGLQAPSGEAVPLNIAVSLPFGVGDETGQKVDRRPLLLDGSGTRVFSPTYYLERRPGTLHFEIPASTMEPMFLPGAPDRYSGTATVIWDSEV